MHPSAFYSMGTSDRQTSIALTWNAMTIRQRKTDSSRNSLQPRRAVASYRSDPQGIDNLRHVASRGIIRNDFAATSMDRQIPSRRPGGMDRRRSRDLQHPMFGRQLRSTHGRCPVGHPAPGLALVHDRPALRLQAVWRCRFCEYRAKLA